MKNFFWKSCFCLILVWTLKFCEGHHPTFGEKERQEENLTSVSLPRPIIQEQTLVSVPESLSMENSRETTKTYDCVKHYDVKSIELNDCKMTQVSEGSFDACSEVTSINLSKNQLTTLPTKIFANNVLLSDIKISGNNLTSVDPGWFMSCAKNLMYLDLSNNFLCQFPIEQLPIMSNLKHLMLSQNHIIDLDEKLTVENFPNLKHIAIQFNQIGCWRHAELVDYFNEFRVDTTAKGFNNNSRENRFNQTREFGCIDEQEWTFLKLTHLPEEIMMNVKPDSMTSYLIWTSLGIGLISIVLSISVISIYVAIHRKFLSDQIQGNRLHTDFGEYYEPCQQNPTSTQQNEGGPANYATVDRNRTRQ